MADPKTIIDLLDQLTPEAAEAFIESVGNVTSRVQLQLLEDAIRRGDTSAVVEILRIRSEYFAPLDMALRDAYEGGGAWVMGELERMARGQGVRVSHVFGANDPQVASWLSQQSSRRIAEISEGQRQAVREALELAAQRTTSARTAALDLVGRINRATGRREGGIVGLTSGEIQTRDTNLTRLLSGEPGEMAKYLRLKTRDKRFDSVVARAIRNGKPVPAEQARKMIGKMSNNLLRNRGERIARTELLGALGSAQHQALHQMLEAEQMSQEVVTQTWDSANDGHTRESHVAMDGQQRQAGQTFITGNGNVARYPGDPNLPANDRIHCRCYLRIRVDFITGLKNRLTSDELAAIRAEM